MVVEAWLVVGDWLWCRGEVGGWCRKAGGFRVEDHARSHGR